MVKIWIPKRRKPEQEIESESTVDGRNFRAKVTGYISLRLTHPMLLGGNLLIRRFHGRPHWEIMHVVFPNGQCGDGLQALQEYGLELDSHKAETPNLVGRDEWPNYQG